MSNFKELHEIDQQLYNRLYRLSKKFGLSVSKSRLYLSNMVYLCVKNGITDYNDLRTLTAELCGVTVSAVQAGISRVKKCAEENANELYLEIVENQKRVKTKLFFFCLIKYMNQNEQI